MLAYNPDDESLHTHSLQAIALPVTCLTLNTFVPTSRPQIRKFLNAFKTSNLLNTWVSRMVVPKWTNSHSRLPTDMPSLLVGRASGTRTDLEFTRVMDQIASQRSSVIAGESVSN